MFGAIMVICAFLAFVAFSLSGARVYRPDQRKLTYFNRTVEGESYEIK